MDIHVAYDFIKKSYVVNISISIILKIASQNILFMSTYSIKPNESDVHEIFSDTF